MIETGRWLGLVPVSGMRFGGKHMRMKALQAKILASPSPVEFIAVKNRTLTSVAERFIE